MQHEAAKVLQDAQTDFAGTQQEARIVIRNAELALQRGDAEAALTMLRAVTPDHPFFLEARKAMAAVYLNHRRDRRLYAACFRELVDRQKTPETLSLLGDAYMELEQPEKAIAAYEEARQMAPEDGGNMELVAKLGGALVRTHNFSEAVKYYRRLVKAGGAAPGLRHRLCELLLSLRLYDDAKATLLKGLADIGKSSDYASVGEAVQLHLLLADVFHSQDEPEKEINQLTEARDLQVKVLRKVGIESPDNVVDEKRIATEISVRLAKWYSASGPENMSKAVRMFEEARSHNEADPETLLELARLHMRMGDVDSCQQHCLSLLRLQDERSSISVAGRTPVPPAVDTFAGQATLMMAELMLQKLDFDTALFHLKKLLAKEPNNYKALAVIVEVLRRNGELENILPYFKTIVDADSNATASAGYNFCKGLHEWYINNNAEALRLLNMARADSEWELQATHLMAEICLNPDNETLGGELLGELDQSAAAAAGDDLGAQPQRPEDKSSSATGNLRTAENLLKDLVDADARTVYLQHMVLVSSKHKGQLEKAMTHFTDIIKRDPNNVLANFGAAVACLVGKQSTKSKTYLSTVVSHPWTLEFAEEFERAWLLLADYHIQNKNTTGAADHLRNCIKYNKSCYSAHEYMGLISEKEQQYREAAAHYHSAWICSHKTNPAIGFKLAFNFLKVQKYVESIEVCLDVLKMNPKYPKIRKEILDKARMCVRV